MAKNAAAAALQGRFERTQAVEPSPVMPGPNEAAKAWNQAGRAGKSNMGAWLQNDFKRSLGLVKAYTGRTNESLYAEALNMLFEKYQAPTVTGEK